MNVTVMPLKIFVVNAMEQIQIQQNAVVMDQLQFQFLMPQSMQVISFLLI